LPTEIDNNFGKIKTQKINHKKPAILAMPQYKHLIKCQFTIQFLFEMGELM